MKNYEKEVIPVENCSYIRPSLLVTYVDVESGIAVGSGNTDVIVGDESSDLTVKDWTDSNLSGTIDF